MLGKFFGGKSEPSDLLNSNLAKAVGIEESKQPHGGNLVKGLGHNQGHAQDWMGHSSAGKDGMFAELGTGFNNPIAEYNTTTQIFIVIVFIAILRFIWLFIKALKDRIKNENKSNGGYQNGNDSLL